jgi:hypothetical protein
MVYKNIVFILGTDQNLLLGDLGDQMYHARTLPMKFPSGSRDVTSGSHVGYAQWYILYYYYSKKKAREPIVHAHVITSGHVIDVTSGQGRFRWPKWVFFLFFFCEGYTPKSSTAKFYRYIPSTFRDITESNFNGSADIGKKINNKLSFSFLYNTACISFIILHGI